MEHPGSHLTDFYAIWYLKKKKKCVAKIQVTLKSEESNGYSA
jgi:hypothetical protein